MGNLLGRIELELLHTPETSFFSKLKNVIFGASAYIIWASLVLFLYQRFVPEFGGINYVFSRSNIYTFISSCILAPIIEEILFRVFPLQISRIFGKTDFTLVVILMSSVVFGWMHHGPWSVPVQGVAGLLFSYVYLKNNYSYISVVIMHFLINFYYFLN